ncbi:MAG: hypothetical protein IT379_41185 [Deltaproteobacteria bacterium]|nr:hypothetical protein [Deltaproteobacteria bacterium]
MTAKKTTTKPTTAKKTTQAPKPTTAKALGRVRANVRAGATSEPREKLSSEPNRK